MDSQKTNELYEKFPRLYRERTAPLESSKMAWGFQCENGWYKIIYEMSKKIDKISTEGEFSPAVTEVSRNKDGTLYVETRNLTPPVADVMTTATEQSRLTCEYCAYTPAFLRTASGPVKSHIACGRCVAKRTTAPKRKALKHHQKARRAPDTIVVKR
jgi:hypothetical protein